MSTVGALLSLPKDTFARESRSFQCPLLSNVGDVGRRLDAIDVGRCQEVLGEKTLGD